MEIILKNDVENLGLEFDTVNVKPGYARNFLIPNGLAVIATPKNKAVLEATLEARKEEEAKLIAEANKKVEQLKKVSITITSKAGGSGKLFGSINNANLAEELAKAGVEIDRKYIKIPGNTIKRIGKFAAIIRLHRDVEYNYEFDIVPEAVEEKEAKKEKTPKAPQAETAEATDNTPEENTEA